MFLKALVQYPNTHTYCKYILQIHVFTDAVGKVVEVAMSVEDRN